MVKPSWDVVNPSLDKPEKEVVVPKEFEHPRRAIQDVAVGPQGRCYVRTWQIGVFYPTGVTYRVFPPPAAGFSLCKL
jgi:hypothetical protein